MKKVIKTMAVFLLLSAAFTSCEREVLNPTPIGMAERSETTIVYAVDGETHTRSGSLEDMVCDLFVHVNNGRTVTFSLGEHPNAHTKASEHETITFTTTSEQEAHDWCLNMVRQGYTVSVEVNTRTGVYTCVATK